MSSMNNVFNFYLIFIFQRNLMNFQNKIWIRQEPERKTTHFFTLLLDKPLYYNQLNFNLLFYVKSKDLSIYYWNAWHIKNIFVCTIWSCLHRHFTKSWYKLSRSRDEICPYCSFLYNLGPYYWIEVMA